MAQCNNCGRSTLNLKYCSRSCSAIINGHKFPKRKKISKGFCLNCNSILWGENKKYCSNICQQKYVYDKWIKDWLLGKIDGVTENGLISVRIKKYLISIRGSSCENCGWSETNSYTKNIPIEMDHKDGNYMNNNIDNLRLLCPNCHSLTATYKGANKGNGRHYRQARYTTGKSY